MIVKTKPHIARRWWPGYGWAWTVNAPDGYWSYHPEQWIAMYKWVERKEVPYETPKSTRP